MSSSSVTPSTIVSIIFDESVPVSLIDAVTLPVVSFKTLFNPIALYT